MPRIFDDKDLANLRRVLESGNLCQIGGKMTEEFEKSFAKRMGAKYAIGCNSAMSGLHVAVAAAGVGPGDEVIVDPIVHFAGFAVMYNNGIPVFADVDPKTHNMDPKSARARVTERTKAIICTHLWGLPCEMDEIMEIAKEHNLVVIEDCAHALLAEYKGRYAGTLGDIGVYSFQMSKHMATGDGGMILTNDETIYEKLKLSWEFHATAPKLSWNFRITELASAVGLAQMEHMEQYVDETIENAKIYEKALEGCDWIVPQYTPEYCRNVYHIWVPLFYGEKAGVDYEEFKKAAGEMGLSCSFGYLQVPAYQFPVFYEPIAYGKGCPIKCPLYQGKLNYQKGACPNAEEIMPRMMLFGTTVADRGLIEKNAQVLRKLIDKFS